MPKVSRETATGGGAFGPVTDRSEELEGYTVNFVTFHEDVDATPLLKGLPDDRCQCPHWGYVLKGRLTYRFPQGEETYEASEPSVDGAGLRHGRSALCARTRTALMSYSTRFR